MTEHITKHLRIFVGGFSECVIATHGGYTPRRKWLKGLVSTSGSGSVRVPTAVKKLVAYSDHDKASIGNFAKLAMDGIAAGRAQLADMGAEEGTAIFEQYAKALSQFSPPSVEVWKRTDEIINYSLTHNSSCDSFSAQYATRDLIRVRPGVKAHLSDVFAAIERLGLNYKVLHYGACRVNKLTYGDSGTVIGGPT